MGICDYIEKEDIKTDNSNDVFVSKSVISYNTKIIKSGGDFQVFTGKFFDKNENEVSDIILKWEVICDFKDALKIIETDKSISIGIDNDDYIDEEFKLVLSDSNGDYASYMNVRIESLL